MKNILNYLRILLFITVPCVVGAESIQPFVDLLAWKAAETNASWVTTLTFPDDTIHVIQSKANFNTRPGIKIGLFYSPTNFWDTKFYLTSFSTRMSQTIPLNAQLLTSLFFSGSFFISQDIFFGGKALWDLDMNMIDVEISHSLKLNEVITLTPRMGIKGGSINQDINITWNAILYNATEKLSNHFTGMGPSFGLNARFMLFKNFNIVSDISTAFLYGRWNNNDIYQRPFTFFTTPTTITTSMSQSKLGTLMMTYYLGLEWIHRGKSNIIFKLGYEMQYWPSQLRLLAVQQFPTFGDLTIQGATCGISIEL